jgi:hypothetical protein
MSRVYEAKQMYSRMVRNLREFESKLLELLRHPDADPESMLHAIEMYRRNCASLQQAREKMLNRFGNYAGIQKVF